MSKAKKGKKFIPPMPVRPDIDLSTVNLPRTAVFNPYDVQPLPGQIRKRLAGISELAASMKVVGQVTPVLVVELSGNPQYKAKLVDGERRLAACRMNNMPIKAFIWDGLTDPKEIYALSVAANFGRQTHDPIEISDAIVQFRKDGRKIKEIAQIFGKSIGWVIQFFSLRKLHPLVRGWMLPTIVANGKESTQNSDLAANLSTSSRKIRAPLSFQLALLLTSRPKDEQVKDGKEIINRRMSLVEARRYIAGENRKAGIVTRKRPPSEERGTLFSVVSSVRHSLGKYIDLPGTAFNELLSGASLGELVSLVRTLGFVAEHAGFMAQIAESEIQKKKKAQEEKEKPLCA